MVKVKSVIETKNLTKRFGEVLAVDALNINVRQGEIYGFLGPNGAGKTTTVKMILGLMHPDNVEVKKEIGCLPERVSFLQQSHADTNSQFFLRTQRC